MNNKIGKHLSSMLQFWILDKLKVNPGVEPDWKLVYQIKGALCHGLRFSILPGSITLQVNVLYKTNKKGYRWNTHTIFDIIDFQETENTLWFKDTVGEYWFSKTNHTIESYIEEVSSGGLKN